MTIDTIPTKKPGIFFKFLGDGKRETRYPAWRYHEWFDPVIVNDTEEDEKVHLEGWEAPSRSVTHVRYLMNWRFDLEDLTPRQLVLFAKDEFGVDLPVEAGTEKLFKSIWRLHTSKPANRDNVVLFAQSMKMNYDETLVEIKRLVEKEGIAEPVEEFWA